MYYPYLRGRQFELLALRGLLDSNDFLSYVRPVIEPVRKDFGSLRLARKEFARASFNPYLIVNPSVGELAQAPGAVADFLGDSPEGTCAYKPAFICNNWLLGHLDWVEKFRGALLICVDSGVPDNEIISLAQADAISEVMLFEPDGHRALKMGIQNCGVPIVRLDNRFSAEQRNADYLSIPPEKFSEELSFFTNDRYAGYSDFTLLPMQFSDGGFLPRAVVIHWSFLKQSSMGVTEIWMAHYTSTSNYSTTNVAGKFMEAAEKLLTSAEKPCFSENQALKELDTYYRSNRYPGLGVLKKLTVQNHILINAEFLSRNATRTTR